MNAHQRRVSRRRATRAFATPTRFDPAAWVRRYNEQQRLGRLDRIRWEFVFVETPAAAVPPARFPNVRWALWRLAAIVAGSVAGYMAARR